MSKSSSSGLTPENPRRLDFDEIKRTTDLVAVIEAHGVALKKEGKDYVGLCPFHDDRKPSLRVSPGKGLWRCMSCEAAGNAIQFVAKKENVSDHEAALRLLAQLPGVQRASQLEEKEPVIVPPAVAADLMQRVTAFYHRTLFKEDRAGLDYLASRHLADPAMLESFRVGYCNGTMKRSLPPSGEVVEQLQALGLLNAKGNEVFYGRVVVPIPDATGNVVGLYGRKVEGPSAKLPADSARHIYLAGGHRAVFNAAAVKASRTLIIVESIFDCLSLWQAGHRATVPLYGAGGWTAHHDELIKQAELDEIVLALNNDEAGRTGTLAAKEKIRALAPVCTVRVFAWPEGVKDANLFFSRRENAAAEFAALLKPKPTAGEKKDEPAKIDQIGDGHEPVITPTPGGFLLAYQNRKYEVLSVEKPTPARLKATVKALGLEPGRFHVETVDLYSARNRRLLATEVARLLRLPVEVTEADLDRVLVASEQHLTKVAGSGAEAPAPSAQDKDAALKLGRAADLVGEISRDLDKLGVVGERTNRLLLYLAMTSRKMADPLAVQVVSGSGAGKSHLQDAVLTLCPEEDLIKLTSLSSQALFYKGEDSLRHKCLAVEEVAGAQGARYAVRNLISAKKLTIETTIKNPVTGKMETQVNTVHGPTAVFETTTDPKTDPETKSRFIVTSIDESPEQTRAILEAQRHRHTLDGLRKRHARSEVLRRHHAFQRSLRTLYVVNNYEPLLAYGDDRLMFRRDHPKYLHLILVVAFLHQHQRPVKRDDVSGIEYIETTLDDIAIANDLALELFGTSLDDLSRPGRELLARTTVYVREKAARTKQPLEKIEFCRRELREAIGWSEYQLRTHLAELVELEYIVPLGGRFGSVFTYRIINDSEDSSRFVPGLKSAEQLRQEAEKLGLTSCGFCEPRGLKIEPRAPKRHLVGTSLNGKHEVESAKTVSSPAVYVNGAATSGPMGHRVYGGAT
jgi:DNA primase catalytic core